jgi:ABC-type protease/lipase transport system fused ATPase/permease subunit
MKWLFVSRLLPFVILAGGASVALNLALLVPSIYMLQVFDRVLSSRSSETLAMLSLLAALALSLGYFADGVRVIAATILLGRALQPVEQLISGWKATIDARAAWVRLNERPAPAPTVRTSLPAPIGRVELQRVVYAPARGPALIKGVSFQLESGESVGIIGRSASGKTTLVRLLLGLLQPQGGTVRLDGADIAQWNRAALGEYVGYLPQDAQLIAGTVAENIARLGPVNSEGVIEAAQLAHAHDMIVRMPEGYDTQIGDAAALISGGQRQRIALARALYGSPRLVILDEPNANLDAEGELALASTLKVLKQRRATVVMVGHRSSLMAQLDKLAVLNEGVLEAFGRSDAVLSRAGAVIRPLHRSPAASAAIAEIQP